MNVREIARFLEQWQMGFRDLHRRLIPAPTPRERERWHALWLLAQGWTASATADALERDPHTVGWWAEAFGEGGPPRHTEFTTPPFRATSAAPSQRTSSSQPRIVLLSALRRPEPPTSGGEPGLHFPCLMKSAMRSPIVRTVTLMLARTHSGMIEASTTRRPSAP